MVQIDFIFQPRKVPRRRERHAPPGSGGANGIAITSVQLSTPATQVKIHFASNVTWNGTDVPSAFKADTIDGPLDGCINVLGSGPNWIEVEFNGDVAVGANWQVAAPMAGITPAVAWPQSGVVTA
jgi:hypothetical protein